MKITEVRIKLLNGANSKLQAFCSVTVEDALAIRDLKIIRIEKGLFVAMPSRKLSIRCGRCHTKNHLRANFCNACGARLRTMPLAADDSGRLRLHSDIVYPINSSAREDLHRAVIQAFEDELARSKLPGYVPQIGVLADDDESELWDSEVKPPLPPSVRQPKRETGSSSFSAGIL